MVAKETLGQLFSSLYHGGLDIDTVQFKFHPHCLQDAEHHKHRMRLEAQCGAEHMAHYLYEVVESAEVPGVITWERK